MDKEIDPNTVTEVLDTVRALVGDKLPPHVRVLLRPLAEKFVTDLLTKPDIQSKLAAIGKIVAAKNAVVAAFED